MENGRQRRGWEDGYCRLHGRTGRRTDVCVGARVVAASHITASARQCTCVCVSAYTINDKSRVCARCRSGAEVMFLPRPGEPSRASRPGPDNGAKLISFVRRVIYVSGSARARVCVHMCAKRSSAAALLMNKMCVCVCVIRWASKRACGFCFVHL